MDHVVITIARQYGSGGRTVGKMLAERLGISFYDKQIIHMASDESGIDVNLFGKIEAGDKIKSSLFGNKSSIYKGDLVLPGNKDFISDENCCFSCTVRSDQAIQLALFDRYIKSVNCAKTAELNSQMIYL